MRISAALALALLIAAPAAAEQTRVLAPGASSPAAKVADMDWLVGEWTGEGFGSVLKETYSAPVGGQMPGHFYAARDGKADFYEFVMIAEVGDSIEYRIRHFNPDMTAWEDKERFIRFPLVAAEGNSWYFDGLTVRRTGADTADHIVRVRGRDGKSSEEVLRYRRTRQAAATGSD